MIETLITLVIVIVIVGVVLLFLRWVMPQLGLPDIAQKIVWILIALLVFLAVLGVFGYGPLKGPW